MNYKCWYHIGQMVNFCAIESIAVAKEGFWIDRDGDFTNGSDCDKWIPPSAVLFVEHFEKSAEVLK